MTRTAPSVLLVAAIFGAACGSQPRAREHASLESLRFEVPAQWKRSDWHERGIATAQWVPDDNDRHESITIVRSERSPATAKAGVPTLQSLVSTAQRSLPGVRASAATPVKTARGLIGARIDVDFAPPRHAERYHRVHVVLAGPHDALIHVMYTARNPDADLTALSIVLDTIASEEG